MILSSKVIEETVPNRNSIVGFPYSLILNPGLPISPTMTVVRASQKTTTGVATYANSITLTPGTLSLDVSDDRKVLYVHAMYVSDKEAFIQSIKNGFERKLLEILR
jgi:multicomponent Na+:H+ antiporter subunit E